MLSTLKKFSVSKPILNKVDETLSIIYLGNIGNIYDFESLFQIIKRLEKDPSSKVTYYWTGAKA